MPRMPGFLQSRSKKEEAEWDLVQSRTAARLAAMFRQETGQEPPPEEEVSPGAPLAGDSAAGDATPLEPASPARRSGNRRPRIIVLGDVGGASAQPARPRARRVAQRGAGPNGWTVVDPSFRDDFAESVPVMTPPEDGHPDEDIWRLPNDAATDLVMPSAAPVEIPEPDAERVTGPDAAQNADAIAEPDAEQVTGPDAAQNADAIAEPVADAVAEPVVEAIAQPGPEVLPGTEAAPAHGAARAAAVRTPARRKSRARSRVAAAAVVPPPAPVVIAHCPYCALVLVPAPTVSRRCERCRQRIMVKRVDGHVVYLTEAAVQVFDAERRRIADSARLTRERERWLRLAAASGAPAGRRAQLAAARLTEEVVAAARALYITTVDRGVREAKRDRDWDGAARIRREQAMALYRLAGSPMPPPADVLAIFREGVAAEMRGVAEISRDAELISARCCDACRADDGRIFRITTELRTPRLPHAGCPKGLCRCHWDLAARDRRTIRRYLQRRPGTASRATTAEAVTATPTEAAPTA